MNNFSQGLVPEDKLKALKESLLNLKKIITAPKTEEKQEIPKSSPPVLSDSVKVCETAEQGRYLVATRDIAVGEQVGCAAATSNFTFKHQLSTGCHPSFIFRYVLTLRVNIAS